MSQSDTMPHFQSFECVNPECRLRFANDLSTSVINRCPGCGSEMVKSGEPYTNFQRPPSAERAQGFALALVLDNLRSAHNVGSIFRTANGAGVRHIYCCGTTPTPDHRGVKKASLGAEENTPWSYHPNGPSVVDDLHTTGNHVLALESTTNSKSLFAPGSIPMEYKLIALVLGNEISGIDPLVLQKADASIYIPMAGVKTSINVAVAAGIVLYWLVDRLNQLHENY